MLGKNKHRLTLESGFRYTALAGRDHTQWVKIFSIVWYILMYHVSKTILNQILVWNVPVCFLLLYTLMRMNPFCCSWDYQYLSFEQICKIFCLGETSKRSEENLVWWKLEFIWRKLSVKFCRTEMEGEVWNILCRSCFCFKFVFSPENKLKE